MGRGKGEVRREPGKGAPPPPPPTKILPTPLTKPVAFSDFMAKAYSLRTKIINPRSN